MGSSEDRRIDDRYAAARQQGHARASKHMEQPGRRRLRVARSENHARAQGNGRETALARPSHKTLGLALGACVRRIDTLQIPRAGLIGRVRGRTRGQGVQGRGQHESFNARPPGVVQQAAGRIDIDGLAEPAHIPTQADPAGRVDHGAHSHNSSTSDAMFT